MVHEERYVVAPLSERRHPNGDHVEAVKDVFLKRPSRRMRSMLRWVAAIMRVSMGMGWWSPPVRFPSPGGAEQLTCVDNGMSPILVEEDIPFGGSSNRPLRSLSAPVNASLTWPKSWLWRNSLRAATDLDVKDPCSSCRPVTAFATSSFPVPLFHNHDGSIGSGRVADEGKDIDILELLPMIPAKPSSGARGSSRSPYGPFLGHEIADIGKRFNRSATAPSAFLNTAPF